MFMTKPSPNPELQKIREEGLKGTQENHENIKGVVERLKPKTSRVHAAWLFYGDERALQKIMRLLDGCKQSTLYAGWKQYANALGVPREVINPIDSQSFGDEGYTYYVLLHFAQLENATIHKVLSALLEISRYDVVTETLQLLECVVDDALLHQRHCATSETNNAFESNSVPIEEDSGYFSSSGSGQMGCDLASSVMLNSDTGSDLSDFTANDNADRDISEIEGNIIKPPTVRRVPLMLKHICENENQIMLAAPIHTLPPIQVQDDHHQAAAPIHELPPILLQEDHLISAVQAVSLTQMQTSAPDKQSDGIKNSQKKRSYTCKVMLTFAEDGISYARDVIKIFRKRRENGQKIGVLVLYEHADTVENNPYEFLTNIFPQVHYVIPIITEGYIKAASTSAPQQIEASYLDCKHVRFIYDLMLKDYGVNGCRNTKIRCIVPNALLGHVLACAFMRQPLFSVWEPLSNTEVYAEKWVKRYAKVDNENSLTRSIYKSSAREKYVNKRKLLFWGWLRKSLGWKKAKGE